VLARMYFLSGQRVEAVEICSSLLKKLPYCLEANRIIAAILPDTDRKAEAQSYRQKVSELDPYLALASPRQSSADSVPDNAVQVDKLDWTPALRAAAGESQPDWAASLGVAFQDEAEEPAMPDWLSAGSAELEEDDSAPRTWAAPASFEAEQEEEEADLLPDWMTPGPTGQESEAEEDEELPDWMKEAGWDLRQGGEEAAEPVDYFEVEIGDETSEEGAIPDWLRAMAPPGAIDDLEAGGEDDTGDDLLPWLEEAVAKKDASLQGEDLLQESQPAGSNGSSMGAVDEIPDWLEELGEESGEAAGEEVDADIPDWLREAAAGEAEDQGEGAGGEGPGDLPGWLQEAEVQEETPAEAKAAEGVFDGISLDDEAETMAWLENLALKQGAKEEELISSPEERSDQIPAWLLEQSMEAEAAQEEEFEVAAVEADTPDWLKEIAAEGSDEEKLEGEIPDWLRDLEPEKEASTEAAEEVFIPETPDLHSEAAREAAEPEGTAEAEEAPAAAEGVFEGLSLDDEDAAMAWMESLALKQGAKEEELITRPEDGSEALPEWLVESAEPAISTGEETYPAAESEEEASREWYAETPDAEIPAGEALPAEIEKSSAEDAGGIVGWFREVEAGPEEVQEEVPVQPAFDDPELAEYGEEAAAEESAAPAGALEGLSLEDEADTMAWLESLALKQGAKEEELITRPEERSDALPGWLAEMDSGVEAEAEAEESTPEPAAAELEQDDSLEDTQPVRLFPVEEDLEAGIEEEEILAAAEGEPAEEKVEEAGDEPELPDWLLEPAESEEEEDAWIPPDLAAAETIPQPAESAPAEMDLNDASLVQLENLPGIGFRLAQTIVDYRREHGPFQRLEDLYKVPGFEPGILDIIRSRVRVEEQPELAPAPAAAAPAEGDPLSQARHALQNNLEEGVQIYQSLIDQEQMLPEIIKDLQEALYRRPVEFSLWQALGDAYMRSDMLQEAMEAYVRAEEILR
jgi:competence ComEA-like helix-hairpin-helix protein